MLTIDGAPPVLHAKGVLTIDGAPPVLHAKGVPTIDGAPPVRRGGPLSVFAGKHLPVNAALPGVAAGRDI